MTPELVIPEGAHLTRAELSQEIADHYSIDPYARRSECLGESQYASEGGRFCAIALLVKPTFRHLLKEGEDATSALQAIPRNVFIEAVQHLELRSSGYWNDLQELHDTSDYWTDVGLSQRGERALQQLKEKYP